ncbi:uncharacterized protein LOC117603367 isoform X1 [Osmia lignaria lignaria]|uniref:uncharacterized protein LOC117603367 isoform X1 n=1 Tax=Osmia lignaria lignaria TaxID=1437193 RepID=UPI00402B5FEF
MTRRRRVAFGLRVCTGVLLLLFSTVAADTTKGPPTSSDKSFPINASLTIPQKNKTILTEFVSTEDINGAIDSNRKNIETVHGELTKDVKAEDEEKVPMSIDEESEVQEIRSPDELDRLSTANSTGGSKLGEIHYETSGKSSSTKTVTEDFVRLSRTNSLTTVTAKPVSEDEKKNKTTSEDDVKQSNKTSPLADDMKGKISKESALNLETVESNIEKVHSEQFQERRKKAEHLSLTKNSEVPDLKEADENKEEGSISLINDTYVNYSPYYKTSTEKNLDSGNQSRAFENATNTEGGAVTHESQDPKEEVEVVGNVTQPVIQRLVEQQSQSSTLKDVSPGENELSQKSNQNEDPSRHSTKVTEAIEQQELISEKNQQKLVQITTERTNHEETTLQAPSSPVPRGRTIAFSGVNEFPNSETKPTTSLKLDTLFSKNISTDKPYPYVKSSIIEPLHNSSNQLDITTEEVSALQNTIGRGGSDEKFIVTEASDVLENSIQQFKPTYYEKPSNESSSTEARSSIPVTTQTSVTLKEANPTNKTVIKSIDQKEIAKSEEKVKNAGNNIPRWSEGHEAKESFDVTGNRITEVSLKPENVDERTYQFLTTESTADPQTELGVFSNVDVQTNAEGSMLTRSSLNATELSTEYPLIKGNFSEKSSVSLSPSDTTTIRTTESATMLPPTTAAGTEETSAGNVTELPGLPDTNGTNEIPSGASGTSSQEEIFVPTTTSVEYEFVGLSESTTFLSRNVTEETSEGHGAHSGISTILPSFTKNSSNDFSTITGETTTDNLLSTDEIEVTSTDDRVSSVPMTDPTVVATTLPNLTTQSDDFTTDSGIIETEQTSTRREEEVQKTISVTESWSTSDRDTTIKIEYTTLPDSKDANLVLNITETSAEFTTMSDISSTDTTRVTTPIPFIPSLQPKIPISSTVAPPAVSDIPIRVTDDTKVAPTQVEVTSLVRIVMEGSLYDVCLKKKELKSALAEILNTGMNKSISDEQIIIHQDPCQESPTSTPTTSDMTSILVYVVDKDGKLDTAMTNILPTLYKSSHVKFPITIHSFLLVQETIPDSGNAIAVVVVSSIAFICLVLLAGLLFIMRKRQTRFNYGERCRPVSLDAYSLDSVSAYNSVRRKGVARSSKRSYGNPTFEDSSAIPSHPLNFAGLSSFCNDVNAINEEFSNIPQVSAKIDEMPTGAEVKNRYANVIPLPETRVPLQKINNDPLSEYINASYVRGPKNATRYYIACQAPMDSTVTDFWRMIWEQQSKVIIMLTDLVENGVEKCTEYIPPSEITDCHRLYGDFQVTLKKRETKEKYAISTLHLKNLENNTFREVYHIWYLWPVNGAQSDGAGLIAVLLEARALQRGGPGPIVVHCSPGTGRTGTLIALDLGIRQYEITRTVDVPRVVYTIRRDRAGAVQTKEQYAFVYKALHLYATKLAGGILEST